MAGGDICALLYAKHFYWEVHFSNVSWSILALSGGSHLLKEISNGNKEGTMHTLNLHLCIYVQLQEYH